MLLKNEDYQYENEDYQYKNGAMLLYQLIYAF